MQNENDQLTDALDGIEATVTTAQQAPADVPAMAQQTAQPPAVSIPQSAFAKLKEEQRRRGEREAMAALEAKFKAAGFGSLDEALAAAAAARHQPAKAQPQQSRQVKAPEAGQYQASTRDGAIDPRQLKKLQQERERLAKQYAQEQAQRRKLQRQLEAKEAEMTLREAAVAHGVRDVDYALRLLQRELDGKSEAELASFNETEFFGKKLRGSHPYLFGETVMPATTGTGATGPAAPKAAEVQTATGQAGQFDARKATAEEFQKELRRRGLSPGGV